MNTLHIDRPFELECGRTLPGLELAYHTFGTLNAEGSNVIWVHHALTANSDVSDWWPNTVVEGGFLDPTKYFVVCVNVIGSCYGSTGPLSVNPATGEPWYGDFPQVSIRDMVRAHRLLARHLGIHNIRCMIGSSMGGYQALEWLAQDGGMVENAVLIATGSHTRPWQAAFNETMRMAIEADTTFGHPGPSAGSAGLAAARAIGLLSYRGRVAYDLTQANAGHELPSCFDHRVHSYQRHQGDKLCRRFNAYSYHRLCSAIDSHDIGRGRASRTETLAGIKTRCLVITISTDLIFPPEDHADLWENIPDCRHICIDSPYAHDGFLVEHRTLNNIINDFLDV